MARMAPLPTVFVSHGAPTLVIESNRTSDFLRTLGQQVPRPRAVLCVSAHWESDQPLLSGSARPPTIHDFYGFPDALYEMSYPAPGDAALARRTQALLRDAGFAADIHPTRGLDHGAWVPLKLAYPDGDIPVVQLSVQPQRDAAHHLALGRALRPLRDDGVLILGSGSATHNLREIRGMAPNAAPPPWVLEFEAWLTHAVTGGDADGITHYLERAPHALRNHPTPEHFLPLVVAMGAGSTPVGRVLHQDFNFAVLSMAAYAWE